MRGSATCTPASTTPCSTSRRCWSGRNATSRRARPHPSTRTASDGGGGHDGWMTRRGVILFVALGIAWGIPYLFIKVAVSELEPQMVVLARAALAAILLVPIAAFRHEIMPVLR